MRRLFVYGSLRRGEFNHNRFHGFGDGFILSGYILNAQLKSLGAYPAIIPSDKDTDRVIGEVYEVPESLAQVIDSMERGAGYKVVGVKVFDENATVAVSLDADAYFFADPSRLEKIPALASGDWTKRKLEVRT